MMTANDLSLSFGDIVALLTAAGVVVALIVNINNLKGKMNEKNPAMIELRMDVKHIRETVDRNNVTVSQLMATANEHAERLIKVEMEAKAAHRRLDELK